MRFYLFGFILLLAACTGKPSFEDPSLGGPKLNLEEYFDGHVVGYGQFQDLFGTARRRFEVDIRGDWDGERLTLTEDFVYADKTTERRVWTLTKTGADTWTGTADGVYGMASGVEDADRFNWKYKIDLPVPEGTLTVNFDDWMWMLDERRVLNRAYMKKAGIDIGEVVIFFEKKR
ncbi:DUF3833 domain-containing protein [Amylibacter sp. IMCC11727]|uniref:DUF3833 domain-containing protein n=1 Tax=Amylibacter sp. IMCC11727 TaxID=3039851 RepID=UPI00244DF9FB|nr:DUF3833 domain-containing protein [Amylibacter sp. IMCC11727]WGI21692.1 DUF3833 domain-containing protein [Amylibacter sp. IMCC11727]